MPGILDHPQALGLHCRMEEFLGLSESCVLVTRSGDHENRCAKSGDRTNRFEIVRRYIPARLELDQQELRQYRRKRPEPDTDSILDGICNSRIHGFENYRIKAGRLRAEQHRGAAE